MTELQDKCRRLCPAISGSKLERVLVYDTDFDELIMWISDKEIIVLRFVIPSITATTTTTWTTATTRLTTTCVPLSNSIQSALVEAGDGTLALNKKPPLVKASDNSTTDYDLTDSDIQEQLQNLRKRW